MHPEVAAQPLTVPTSGRRLKGIEGMRAIACLTILVAHAVVTLPAAGHAPAGRVLQLTTLGMHGLTMFFVLSGFLLYLPFVRHALAGDRQLTTRTFYRNRVLRIAPAYLVIFSIAALVLGSVVISPIGPGESVHSVPQHLGRMTDPVDFLLNLTLLQGYVPRGVRTGLMVSWSLVPEVAFYVLLPVLALLGRRLARLLPPFVAMLVPPLLLLIVGRVTTSAVAASAAMRPPADRDAALYGDTWTGVLYNSFPSVAHVFGMGMGVAVFYVAASSGLLRPRLTAFLRAACATVLVLALIAIVARPLVFGMLTASILCSAFLAWVMLPSDGPVRGVALRALESAPAQFVGLISYSLYLWHFPLIGFALLHVDSLVYDSTMGMVGACVATLAVSLAISWVTFRWVESPALNRKRTISQGPAHRA